MDVTSWDTEVDQPLAQRLGDPVFMCFGEHDGFCPLGGSGHAALIIDIAAGDDAHRVFAELFASQLDRGVDVQIRSRHNGKRRQYPASRVGGNPNGEVQ